MNDHHCAWAAPPWTNTRPGLPLPPHDRYLIGVPLTVISYSVGSFASDSVNQDGEVSLTSADLFWEQEPTEVLE
jgi:hypothetical protein